MTPPSRPFRLLHFQSTAGFGGDESNSLLLCRHLPEMRHHVAVYFGAGPMQQTWLQSGAEVSLLNLNPRSRRAMLAAVRATVKAVQPDGIFLSSIVRLPLVLEGLDDFAGEVLCHTGNPDASSLLTRLKFQAARAWLRPRARVTMVHCSDYVRQSYVRNSFYAAYRHEVAISAGLMDPAEQATAHQPRVVSCDSSVRLGMVARLDPIKNHRLVIDAFRGVLADFPAATLEFIGDGVERENLEAHARKIGVADRVIFHGRLPSPFPVARTWDLFLYATTAAEGFGAALAEAIALGLPCVVTDVGPMREVGGEEGAVRYVPPDSPAAMAATATALLEDVGVRRAMSADGRARASAEFDGAVFARKVSALLHCEYRSERDHSTRRLMPTATPSKPVGLSKGASSRPPVIDAVASIGDAGDINCWSGTPYHFSVAARADGNCVEPWRLDMARFTWPRRRWNVQQLLLGRGRGGFQYSDAFARTALTSIEPRLRTGRVLSFNQHFPPASALLPPGGKLCLYLDATFPLLLDRYGLARHLSPTMQAEGLAKEREAFARAEWLVFFQRWSAESAVRDCGADPARVRVICPGANLNLPADWDFGGRREPPSVARPLVLGFIGKDWKRKGLPFLIRVRQQLVALGVPTVIRCAGGVPADLPADAGVESWGFINKHTEPARFFEFLKGCDLGCLFSEAEASSIAVLEFLRAGIPVAGFVVDGMVDLFPPDAGFRFQPGTTAEAVAEAMHAAFASEAAVGELRAAARAWSPLVTWERCVGEWKELLTTGQVRHPVQPWRGLSSRAEISRP